MAELDTSGGGGKGGKVRTKKKSTRVDLTAMVDLAFLLVTFFMLTTTLSKPKAMDLVMPDKDEHNPKDQMAVPATRTMTILLGSNDRIEWYHGLPGQPLEPPTKDNFGKNGIRKSILDLKKKVYDATGGKLIVLVKPSDKSVYKDVVNIMDELNITQIDIRAIVDILPGEVELLKRDNLY